MNNPTRKILLIVEDELSMTKILRDEFTDQGFEVIEATDGEEGLNVAYAHHPDLILLDLLMPKTGGMSMLEKLRTDEWGKNVPVVILTNLNDVETISKAMEAKTYDYLVKSDWDLKRIVNHVKTRLGIPVTEEGADAQPAHVEEAIS